MSNIFKINIDSQRIFGLDILRALAILFVVIEHGGYLLPNNVRRISDLLVFDGVSVFFVLSGFLIGGILIRMINDYGINKEMLLNFWIRRWCRTLPSYYLILTILFFLNFFFTNKFTFRSVKRYFIFMQNLYEGHPSFFPEAWSLSIEEWFYLVVPILIFFIISAFKVTHKQSIFFGVILVIFVITFFRYVRYTATPVNSIDHWDWIFRKQVITRVDSLMYGVIGAYISFYYNELWAKRKKLLFTLGLFLLICSRFIIPKFVQVFSIYFSVFSFSLVSTSVLLLLPYLSDLKINDGFFYQIVTRISLISYSMYLLNLSIIQYWIINKIPWNYYSTDEYLIFIMKYSLYWVLLFSASIILYKYFELPIMKFRENKSLNKLIVMLVRSA